MSADLHDLTSGSLPKKVLFFSLPLIATNLLQVLFNMADIAVVGLFAGETALGAVGSTATLVTLLTGFLIGVGSGVNVVAARYIGAHRSEDVREAVHTAFLLCLMLGIGICVLSFALTPWALSLLGTKAELMAGAVIYLRIYSLGLPATAIFNFGNAVLSASGETRKPLIYLSFSGILNVLLNLFFVIVCRLATAGVALSTIISQTLSAFLILRALVKMGGDTALRRDALRIEPHKARQLLALSLPAGLQNAIFALANLFIQAGVNTFSATMVEGNSAAANADALVYDVMAAFYTACSSFMGQNYGAGKRKRVLHSYLISMAYAFFIALGMGSLLFLYGRQFLSLFTTSQEVISAGLQRLNIMSFCYCVSAFMDCTIAASRGLGKSGAPTVIVILGSCVFRVIWVYTIFAHFRTIPSLYLLYVFSWTITALAEIAYFIHAYRQQVARLSAVNSSRMEA